MAVRINKAKNFRNKAYVAVDELDNLINTLAFTGTGTPASHVNGNQDGAWIVNFTPADSETSDTNTLDLTSIKDYIDNKSITVTAGNGIAIDDTTNPLSPTISADIDLKAVTTESGYAATYQLFVKNNSGTAGANDVDGYTPIGTKINIVKDNLVKEGTLVYNASASPSYGANGLMTGESATKIDNGYAFVKLTLNTNTNGDATDEETLTYLYIPVNDLFHDKTAGNGIDSTALASNIIQVVVDGTSVVYTAQNTSASILSVDSTGIHAANIQGAINYAVKNEHEKASAAISGVNANVTALGSATSAAVVALNTRVETVATNAAAAVNSAVADIKAIDSKVDSAIDDVNEKVESAVDAIVTNVNTAVGTTITNVNTAVSGAIDTVNTKVNGAVSNVNTQVTALKDTVSSSIDDVNTQVTALTNKVYSTISANNTALDTAVSNVNTNVSAVVTNVNTVLKPNTSTCAVTLVEETPTITLKSGTTGVYETTVTAKYVLNVFSENGDEIYPDIVRGANANAQGQYTFTLTADYGAAQNPIEAWKVICANDVTSVATPTDVAAPATVNTVAYTNATNSVGYTDAGNGTDASYSPATAATATAVDAGDAEYDTSEITDKSVANGTGATVPAVPTAVQKVAPDYTSYANA